MGNFSPWHGFILLMMVAVPAAMVVALAWWVRRGRQDPSPVQNRASAPGIRDADPSLPPAP